jgi:hypothetical protein
MWKEEDPHLHSVDSSKKNKLEISRLQSLLLFEVSLYPMERVSCGFVFTLLYLSRSVPPLTSVQQHSLCSAASCLCLLEVAMFLNVPATLSRVREVSIWEAS